jgi:hypothetical protein
MVDTSGEKYSIDVEESMHYVICIVACLEFMEESSSSLSSGSSSNSPSSSVVWFWKPIGVFHDCATEDPSTDMLQVSPATVASPDIFFTEEIV